MEETATAAKEVEDTAVGDATEGDAAEGAEETTQTDAAETAGLLISLLVILFCLSFVDIQHKSCEIH